MPGSFARLRRRRLWGGFAVLVATVAVPVLQPRPALGAETVVSVGMFGDSFAAGEGLAHVEPGEEGCQRALGRGNRSTAWGVQVTEWLHGRAGSRGPSWLAACTGARTKNYAGSAQTENGRRSSQKDEAKAGAGVGTFNVALNTFGINDLAAYDARGERTMTQLVVDCIGLDEAVAGADLGLRSGAFGGWMGSVAGGALGGGTGLAVGRCRRGLEGELAGHLDATVRRDVRGLLDDLYQDTTDRGLVVLGGYPRFHEDPDDWPRFNKLMGRCQMFSEADVPLLRRTVDRLNRAIEQEVDAARRRHPDRTWVFADVTGTFDGHALCTRTGDQWLNGIVVLERFQRSYHPTQEGQDAYARAVVAQGEVREWAADVEANVAASDDARGVAGSTTSLVVDVSSSMEEPVGSAATRKLDVAIGAARDVLGLMEKDAGLHTAGLVAFSASAAEVVPVTADLGSVDAALGSLVTQTNTDIGAGLELGMAQLAGRPGNKTLVLLSDGQANVGMGSTDILAAVAPQARAAGIRIFPIGFGAGDRIDEDLLRSLASATDGDFNVATTPLGLRTAFVEARYGSVGSIVGRAEGQVAQGQVVEATTFSVPPSKQQLHVALAWSEGDLDSLLYDPQGRLVDGRYRGARLFRDQNPELAVVTAPMAGPWTLKVEGKASAGGAEEYVALASTRGTAVAAPAQGSGLLLTLVAVGCTFLLAGGGVGFAVARRRHRAEEPAVEAGLVVRVLNGTMAGRTLHVRAGDVVGRDAGVDHWLGDETVSRRHAQFVCTEDAWAVVDLRSTSGTYRNGQGVLRARLEAGDVLTLGAVDLRVEEASRG